MEYIIKTESINTGGGNYVDFLTLFNGMTIAISDEYVGLYASIDDFLNDDGTKCLNGFYIKGE